MDPSMNSGVEKREDFVKAHFFWYLLLRAKSRMEIMKHKFPLQGQHHIFVQGALFNEGLSIMGSYP
jgi:hypothetical protein